MSDYFLLSQGDRELLQQVLDRVRREPQSSPDRGAEPRHWHAGEIPAGSGCYVAIPQWAGREGVDTTSLRRRGDRDYAAGSDVPGLIICDIYQIQNEELRLVFEREYVYNLSMVPPAQDWMVVYKTVQGDWITSYDGMVEGYVASDVTAADDPEDDPPTVTVDLILGIPGERTDVSVSVLIRSIDLNIDEGTYVICGPVNNGKTRYRIVWADCGPPEISSSSVSGSGGGTGLGNGPYGTGGYGS